MRYSNTRKAIMAVWAVVETLLFGGLIFGWGSIVYVLKDRGIYSDLCGKPVSEGFGKNYTREDCSAQDARLSLVFTIDSAFFGVGCAVIGQINFRYGTRVTRIISSVIFLTGTLLMAFESPSIPWLVFPGLACVGIGGIALFMTNAQIGKLFKTGGSTFVSLLSGSVSTSAIIELLAKVAYEYGFSMKYFYFLLTGLYSMTFVSTFLFLPKGFINRNKTTIITDVYDKKKEIQKIYTISYVSKLTDEENNSKDFCHEDINQNKLDVDYCIGKPIIPQLKHCLLSKEYILQVYWFAVLQLLYFYFLSSLNPWLNEIFHGDQKQVSHFTNVLLYLMLSNFLFSPVVGALYDWFKQYYKGSLSKKRRDMMPAVIPLMCGSILGLLISILISIPATTSTLYPTFAFLVIYRSFVYSSPSSLFSSVFPAQFFGSLFGIMVVSGGIIGLSQFALFSWAKATNFTQVHNFLMVLTCTTFIHPLIQWKECRKMESSMQRVPNLLKS